MIGSRRFLGGLAGKSMIAVICVEFF